MLDVNLAPYTNIFGKRKKMTGLFEATELNGMKIKNRFVRSATYEAMAGLDGTVKDQLCGYMDELSRGGVGLIITGHAHVTQEGQAGPRQMGIYAEAMIDGLQRITSIVHENGGVIAVQLAHAGQRGIGKDEYAALGPSDIFDAGVKKASAMSVDDIKRTVIAFGDAAKRAVASGFDGIQIHAAHGYLLSQFLSTHYNKRSDSYGGILENRARLLLEVYKEIRQRVGKSFPVMVKINSEDFLDNGITVEETIKVAHMLEDIGMDAIEMSGGTFESGKLIPSRVGTSKSEEREVYYRKAAEKFKKEIGIPLILVGGFLSFNVVQDVVASGLADYVALSRPLIREPNLLSRWAGGDRTKAACISCNKCFSTLSKKEALHCPVEKKSKE
jgi:2,4-dienoyl-CoA reductase-like NADH-dependent reductase (Old Yellow Enzyme family)